MEIERSSGWRAYTCPSGDPTAAQMIDITSATAFSMWIPAGAITTLTFYGSYDKDVAPTPIHDHSNNPVTLTVTASKSYWGKEELFAFPFIGIKANASEAIKVNVKR